MPETLNRHSLLKRHDADCAEGQPVHCGQRVYCSNRNGRPGCGRTVALTLSHVAPRSPLRLDRAWTLLVALLAGLSVRQARLHSQTRLSLSAVYAWVRRFRLQQDHLRTHLVSRGPPPTPALVSDPLLQTLSHLQSALGHRALCQFQFLFQCPLFSY